MKLVVGLGNPGGQYAGHRHNIGFMALDRIVDRHRLSPWRKRFQGVASDGHIATSKLLLLKPETFMNESGRAVGDAMRFLKIQPADVIVFHDELDLEPGRLKIKFGGGNAGHNGLRSISAHIGNDYVRVRLGIGHPGHKDLVSGYVLHDFAKADREWLGPVLDGVSDALPSLMDGSPEAFVAAVARAVEPRPTDPKTAIGNSAKLPRNAPDQPMSGGSTPPEPAAVRHPSGDRAGKSGTALAENLKKFLAGRARRDD